MSGLTPAIDGRGVASIARNLTYLLGGYGVYFVTRFLYAVILARALGPQVYGIINYGIAWYLLFLPLTRMGLEVVLSRDAGKNRQVGDRTAALTLTLRIASISLATAAYVILSWFIEDDPASRLMVFVSPSRSSGAHWLCGRKMFIRPMRSTSIPSDRQSDLSTAGSRPWPFGCHCSAESSLNNRDPRTRLVFPGLLWLGAHSPPVFPLRLDRNFSDLAGFSFRVFLWARPCF